MAIHPFEEQNPYDERSTEVNFIERVTSQPDPAKRQRWATYRAKKDEGLRKRKSILSRFHRESAGASSEAGTGTGTASDEEQSQKAAPDVLNEAVGQPRTIYFNRPLPDTAKDQDGHPTAHYARNKIRTAKYTALSFVPKNLYFQFHNVANIYFLLIVILGAFSIFGVANAALNAAPLIVILFITAIKDAIEDARRTILDNELNNSPVHRLSNWVNVNTADDKISLWRRLKKATTRGIASLWGWTKKRTSKKKEATGKNYAERALDLPHHSAGGPRPSFQSERLSTDVELANVPASPNRNSYELDGYLSPTKTPAQVSTSGHLEVPEKGQSSSATPRQYGSVVDPLRQATGKATFRKDTWKNVQVGDFVRLYNEEPIPADIVILNTSDPDGACYVETKNLDGETNLKVRQALNATRQLKSAKWCEKADFYIESEAPHPNLYAYSAVARWNQRHSNDPAAPQTPMAEPISINNLLLRGCNIRNTDWVLGVVVFTGQETKIMLNSGITPSKRARISRDLNWNVIYNFVVLFFMCLVAGIVNGVTTRGTDNSFFFFEYGGYGNGSAPVNGLITFWAAVILYQNLVPISLYITLEIIRTLQAFFIYSDHWMYYEKVDYPCTPKSWNISDDLGQIEYIFSDKTGTLTQNVMEFKKVTIAGVPYGEAYTEAQAGMQKRQGVNIEAEGARARQQIAEDRIRMLSGLREIHDNPYLRDEDLTFVAPDFVDDLKGQSGTAQKEANEHFMLVLALCHTVITEKTPGDPPRIEFKAQSPDEAALVATARDCGFTVVGRTRDGIVVNVLGKDIEYQVLNILEFNSSRKRMSAILRMPDGKIILFCKGADSVIYSRLARGEQQELRQVTAEHLEMFAREGLRTLCISQRELSEEEYREWNKEHEIAAAAIDDREAKLERVSDMIEQNLTLIGGTAIEDRLQEGVPDAIALLANAGIKLWVLTGDKVETAINIGFSCNLLHNDMDMILFRIEDENLKTAEAELEKHLATFGLTGSDEELKAARKDHSAPAPTHAIVIDGESLRLVLSDALKQKFLLLCKQCKSVLCCRVSPAQKAAVVSMVKHGLDVMTLSIGDGANDVAMIQEADVGVGIAGEEGRQAVMSSDFAIGQFRFLARLVIVHGRWCYRRMGEVIANFFYKNIVWTFALFWYSIYNNFDCSYIFDYTYILLYNLAFTSLAVIFMGIFDQDVSDKVSLAVPQLYRRGIERKEWTETKFWTYMFDGLYQSLICFFMPYLIFAPAVTETDNGLQINDQPRMGVYIACAAVVVVNLYILLNTFRWDYATFGITVFSILLIWFWTGVYTAVDSSFLFFRAAPQVYGQLSFWALTLLVVIVCLLPRFFSKAVQKIFFPRDIDIVREQVRQHRFDYLDNIDYDKMLAIQHKHEDEAAKSLSSSDATGTPAKAYNPFNDATPIINHPPSTAHTTTTRQGPHSTQGSDDSHLGAVPVPPLRGQPHFVAGNDRASSSYYGPQSGAQASRVQTQSSPIYERPRPSFDRFRSSMDVLRPSFEQARVEDFSGASALMATQSAASGISQSSSVYPPEAPPPRRH